MFFSIILKSISCFKIYKFCWKSDTQKSSIYLYAVLSSIKQESLIKNYYIVKMNEYFIEFLSHLKPRSSATFGRNRKCLQPSYLRQASFRCQTSATMKKAVGRKVCGFKIVGRINELDNRWRFRRRFRKQLSLGPFEVEFSTRIYRVYRSTAPSCRDFLLKSCISFARFPGILARS